MEVLKTIEDIIKIPLTEDEFGVGAVCFANDEDVRADFKLQFTIYDVVNYVYGIYQLDWEENKKTAISILKIPYPANASFFWKYANLGKKFRLENPIKQMELLDPTTLNWISIS